MLDLYDVLYDVDNMFCPYSQTHPHLQKLPSPSQIRDRILRHAVNSVSTSRRGFGANAQ